MLAATYKYLQYNNSCNQMLFAADHKGSRTCSVLLRYFLNFFLACDLYYIILYKEISLHFGKNNEKAFFYKFHL